jgi:hypothetical protein
MDKKQISFETSKELAERIRQLMTISILTVNGITCNTETVGTAAKVTVTALDKELLSACNMIAAFYQEERTDLLGRKRKKPRTPEIVMAVITKAHAELTQAPLPEDSQGIPFERLA